MGSLHNSNSYPLDLSLKDILSAIEPSEQDIRARNYIIDKFRDIILSMETLRGATVEPFGSFVSKLYTRWGDLDISIQLPCGSLVSSASKKRKQNALRDVWKVLRKRGVVRNLQFIPSARVPLLAFESNLQGITCDISVDNLIGQIKSKLFLWITEIDGRFREMVLLIKEWAKSQNINDPKSGTLNSYSLCLLVIFHFQTCNPAILPPLKEIYAGNISDDLTGVRVTAEREIHDVCNANIARFKRNLRSVNTSSLSELLISFFQKFSRINIIASEQVICTYTGQWEDKGSNVKWMSKCYPLLIEDPFEMPGNAARAVSAGQLTRISQAFSDTYRKLLSTNQNRNYLISSLARPHITSEILARTQSNPTRPHESNPRHYQAISGPVARPTQGPGHYQPTPGVVPPPAQNQFQFRGMRYGTHPSPSVSSQQPRPPNVSHPRPQPTANGQGQQAWKPRQPNR